MSKFNSDSTPNKRYNPNKTQRREIEFVNIHLTESDQPALEKHIATMKKGGIDPLDMLLMAGYKVSVNVDYDNECYIVSTTGGERTLNCDKCVSSRSDDLEQALFIANYKCFRNGEAVQWESKPKRFNWG